MIIRGNTIGTPIKPEKNLVKATDLTEEEKRIARANLEVPRIIVDENPPSSMTKGAVGDFAVVKSTGAFYKCTAAEGGVYTWVLDREIVFVEFCAILSSGDHTPYSMYGDEDIHDIHDKIAGAMIKKKPIIVEIRDEDAAYDYYTTSVSVTSDTYDPVIIELGWVKGRWIFVIPSRDDIRNTPSATFYPYSGGSVDLSNYYTKDETNQLAQELFNGLEIPSNAFIYEEAVAAAEFVVNREIGDISSALDELHAYAEALKGGGAV